MSIATVSLKYGWRIVAGAVLTGATIFTAENVVNRIFQRDVVELVLGVTERCMATQTGTNADGTPIYVVAPPSFVRSWVTTNGLTGTNFAWVTNQVTNTIAWYTDREMMKGVDSKISELCPHYIDTGSVSESSASINALTFTGLVFSINGHANFTDVPCFTNNAGQTNATTNAAVFGVRSWSTYRVAWQERYKALNALQYRSVNWCSVTSTWGMGQCEYEHDATNWSAAKAYADAHFSTGNVSAGLLLSYSAGAIATNPLSYAEHVGAFRYSVSRWNLYAKNPTIFDGELTVWIAENKLVCDFPCSPPAGFYSGNYLVDLNPAFNANGTGNTISNYHSWLSVSAPTNAMVAESMPLGNEAAWCAEPTEVTGHFNSSLSSGAQGFYSWEGAELLDSKYIFAPQFSYCTNHWW